MGYPGKETFLGTKVEKKNLFLWHVDFKQPMEHKRRSIKKWTEENGVTLLRRKSEE